MTASHPAPAHSRHGVTANDKADPIGFAVSALNRLAQLPVLDRFGLRRPTERAVFEATRTGFRTVGAVNRRFARAGSRRGTPARVPSAPRTDLFDLTPAEDEQMLVDVVTELADEVLRPAAAEADDASATPDKVLAVSSLAPGAVATALSLWGTEEQQATYLPAFTGDDVPAAALALTEPRPLFDPLTPATTATRDGDGYVLNGVKSMVPRGADAELFVVGAMLDGEPRMFVVESGTPGVGIEADPAMGLRAAALTRVVLDGVRVGEIGLLGTASDTAECVRLSRVAWSALAVGTAQAVLDYVIPYVNERQAFGEPVSHRQGVAFMVADIGIELQGMRLVTYRAAARAAQGKDFTREAALARKLCAERGMRIGNDGVQLLGGHGFVKEHPVERWYRDLRAVGVMEGTVLV